MAGLPEQDGPSEAAGESARPFKHGDSVRVRRKRKKEDGSEEIYIDEGWKIGGINEERGTATVVKKMPDGKEIFKPNMPLKELAELNPRDN